VQSWWKKTSLPTNTFVGWLGKTLLNCTFLRIFFKCKFTYYHCHTVIDNLLLSHICVDLIFSDHTHQVKMNMLGEPSFQGSGQSQHESEMGSNAALTELDKGLSSLRCCPIEQDRVTEASSDTGRGHSNRLEHYVLLPNAQMSVDHWRRYGSHHSTFVSPSVSIFRYKEGY
jgi:hypothetical protein